MPSEHSPQEQNTQKWSLHFPTTACSSLAKHRKRQKQKHVILRALTAIPCSWCTSDIRQMGEVQHSPLPVPLHSTEPPPLPFQGAFKPELFWQISPGTCNSSAQKYQKLQLQWLQNKNKGEMPILVFSPHQGLKQRPPLIQRFNKEKSGELNKI